jgi:lipopolysaccharide heptosyltransferase I
VVSPPPSLAPDARILIVRLSALGDIIHALPVLAALRRQYPDVTIDWLVEASYAPILSMVSGRVGRVIVRAPASSLQGGEAVFSVGPGYLRAMRFLRARRYAAALDLQGLIKSALWARLSGARRVIGFASSALRERQAAWFYTETVDPAAARHVIRKNLSVARHLGAAVDRIDIPLEALPSEPMTRALAEMVGRARYAVLNPGAAWPNKRWPAERFAALAVALFDRHAVRSVVTWGPSESDLAQAIVARAGGAAVAAPPTSLGDLAWLMRSAALVVSGDTGPLHLAAAMGAPLVGLYGPTWPERNGPWEPEDEVISRAEQCRCHHKRRCQIGAPCIETITLEEVVGAAERRLAKAGAGR